MYVHRTVRWMKWLAAGQQQVGTSSNDFQNQAVEVGSSTFSFFIFQPLRCGLYRLAGCVLCVCQRVCSTVTLLLSQSYIFPASGFRQKIILYSLFQFRLDLGDLLFFRLILVLI